MTPSIADRLDALYKRIPTFECIRGCTDCCGPLVVSPTEHRRAPRLPTGNALTQLAAAAESGCFGCPYETADGCANYADRPFICRIYGAVDDDRLRCPHGRAPVVPLHKSEGEELLREYMAIVADDRCS